MKRPPNNPPLHARRRRYAGAALILTLVILVAVGMWKTSPSRPSRQTIEARPVRAVMGTTCSLAVVVKPRHKKHADAALRNAEKVLRQVEAEMSTWLADSQLGRLNAAAAGQEIALSPQSLEVLRAAREATEQTDGAFDATCRPLIALWRDSAARDTLPDDVELNAARAASSWELIELTKQGAVKHNSTVQIDLGAIAKGYAIDRAAAVLKDATMDGIPINLGGMVNLGGDLACFGQPAHGEHWIVDVKHPHAPAPMAKLRLRGGAVCTSGNYARFLEIDGERFNHIIDPRSGRPAEMTVSVTVVASTAMTADIWATALSVLGPAGFDRLPDGVDALMITSQSEGSRMLCTEGFRDLLEHPLPAGLSVVARP